MKEIKKQAVVNGEVSNRIKNKADKCLIPGDLPEKANGRPKDESYATWRDSGSGGGVWQDNCGPVKVGC